MTTSEGSSIEINVDNLYPVGLKTPKSSSDDYSTDLTLPYDSSSSDEKPRKIAG